MLAANLHQDEALIIGFLGSLDLTDLVPVVDPDGATARRYGVFALPVTFFIGPDGVVRRVEYGGPMSDDVIRRGIPDARGGGSPYDRRY